MLHPEGGPAAEARRAFGSMAVRDSLDDIRDEDDSQSDSDFSDRQIYGNYKSWLKGLETTDWQT